MKFDKNHKVKIETLDEEGAKNYIFFLEMEEVRHRQALKVAKFNMRQFKFAPNLVKFYKTAKLRHEEDIADIRILISQVRERFKL